MAALLKKKEYYQKQQELRAFAKSLGVALREAGKDGKQTKFRGMGALKQACKVVQPRLCQAWPGSQIAEARRAQLKRKAAEKAREKAAEWRRKLAASARRGDTRALATIQKP